MRAKGLLVAALAALAVGITGLLVLAPITAAPVGPSGWGPSGMMGDGSGMMGGAGMAGMMGGPVDPNATPIGMDRAAAAAQGYIAGFGNPNLQTGEVMEFAANYYVQVVEKDTGLHALELLVDKYSGAVFPEMGPNMVWNTKYGMMRGMMGGRPFFGQGTSPDLSVSPAQAQELARQYLMNQGLQLDLEEPDRFYGYYTIHTVRDGAIEGMLSVNGYTGQIWYHTWHGPFVQTR
ncbi:MAG TPA: hypothetical protein VHS06_02530 [Chloroflexota bacterium]|nr:hypothetical protein [Chloroflexota bacterium]